MLLAAIVRAAGPTETIAFSDLVHSYREAYLACYQPTGDADQEVSGDEVRRAFALALRPESDTRPLDRTVYGETTDRIIQEYRFVVPKILDLVTLEQPVTPGEPVEPPAGDTTSP